MSVEIISKIGGFHYHIHPHWDSKTHSQKHKIVETGDLFKTERGAMRKVKRILKQRKKEYLEKYKKRRRLKPVVKRCRTKPVIKSNVWTQLNIQGESLQ
jgi:hypothetical protein